MNDLGEFYIGWQSQAPAGLRSYMRRTIAVLALLWLGSAAVTAIVQSAIGVAVFEWGTIKTFAGVLRLKPYPHLLVERPGTAGAQSSYYLVAPFKFGLNTANLAGLEGKFVTLRGTLIYRGTQTMIEARPESIRLESTRVAATPLPNGSHPERRTLVGEIVDSKCYLGVMNPGRLTTHRACAVRCISGGIPPVLLVRQQTGPPLLFLLVDKTGAPVNQQILDMVAEPVEVTGEVEQHGDLRVLRADPKSYRRVAHL